ncbi:MAG: dihydrolipoamide acetyltransferase family protein [Phycisphaerales bacterium]
MAGVKQPDDKSYFILPDLGEGVAEAELIEWKVKPGDKVAEHQTLAEMETDKARVEVPSPWAGTIATLNGEPGDIINVGAKLVLYDIGSATAQPAAASSSKSKTSSAQKEPKKAPASPVEEPDAEREDAGTVVGSVGGEMKISSRFVRRAEENGTSRTAGKALATPAVRRIARELGVNINTVEGTGRGGRVTAGDVEASAASTGSTQSPSSTPARAQPQRLPATSDGIAKRIPIRGIRRKIAQALTHSVRTAVHFTVVDEVDVTALEAKRKELMYATGEKFSLLPFIMTAACKALRIHPALNAIVDDENAEIQIMAGIHLGCAVDTADGLMVPVLFDADQASILELAQRVADLAKRSHARTIPREELMGSTFTITNVGSYGGMFATPIINYPEVAILAAGRAHDKVMPRNGGIAVGRSLPLSLSCDHRVVDGAEGARFLNTVKTLLERPEKLLRED